MMARQLLKGQTASLRDFDLTDIGDPNMEQSGQIGQELGVGLAGKLSDDPQ